MEATKPLGKRQKIYANFFRFFFFFGFLCSQRVLFLSQLLLCSYARSKNKLFTSVQPTPLPLPQIPLADNPSHNPHSHSASLVNQSRQSVETMHFSHYDSQQCLTRGKDEGHHAMSTMLTLAPCILIQLVISEILPLLYIMSKCFM